MEKITLTVHEFCSCVGIGRTTAFQIIRDRKVASFLIGRKRLITVESVKAFLAQCEAASAAPNG